MRLPLNSMTSSSGPGSLMHGVLPNSPASPNPMPQLRPPRPLKTKNRDKSGTFEEHTWARRPPPEDVYDSQFFPGHDLDKPVIEVNSGGTSPTTMDHTYKSPNIVDRDKALVRTKKSIHVVAEEHKKRLDHVSTGDSSADNSIGRKRSAKLWDSRVEEVDTSLQTKANLGSQGGGPGRSKFSGLLCCAKLSFYLVLKWVRGELLAKGTYGRVYLALDATTGEMFAVKQVENPIAASTSDRKVNRQMEFVQALKTEIETLKDLDHPHIVQYLGFEETKTFLSM